MLAVPAAQPPGGTAMTHAPDLERARRYLATAPTSNPLVLAITGSHFYGFPSHDSDLDLKGIHITPTAELVSLDPPGDTLDFLGDFEGTEVDYTSHEIGFALKLLIKGNGNVLERVLSPHQVATSMERDKLEELAREAISKRFYSHYRGFMATMRDQHLKAERKTAKGLLYVYRSALTGIHLLLTGDCVGDITFLAPKYGFHRVADLIERKRSGVEHGLLEDATPWEPDLPLLDSALEQAFHDSKLPEVSENLGDLSSFLVSMRRAYW
jgi:predicted nucleotidyltransferase